MGWTSFASVAQYLLPLVCLFAAAGLVVARYRRRPLGVGVGAGESTGVLHDLSSREFVTLLGEALGRQGYQVTAMGVGGVDLVIRKDRESHLVQCKAWKADKVGVDTLRELCAAMQARSAAGGFAVTAGRFSREASAFATARNVRLIEGPALLKMLQQSRAARAGVARQAGATRAM